MQNFNTNIPRQRLSYQEKTKDDNQWGRDVIDSLCYNAVDFVDTNDSYYKSDFLRKLTAYRLYNNILDQKDFEKECDPLGIEAEEFKDIIQPYNKSYNKINVLLGEEWKRPMNFKAFMIGNEGSNRYIREKGSRLKTLIDSNFEIERQKYTMAMAQGIDPSQLDEEQIKQIQSQVDTIIRPQDLEKFMNVEWRDSVEIASDEMLQFLLREQDIKLKKNDGFKHALLGAEEFTWVGEINGKPTVELLNSLKVFYHKSSEVRYIQDGFFAGYRQRMTVGDVLDRYGESMSKEDKDKIDEDYRGGVMGMRSDLLRSRAYDNKNLNTSLEWRLGNKGGLEEGSYGASNTFDIDVVHVEWRSQRKVGFLTFIDEEGVSQMELVDEKYTMPPSAKSVKYKDNNNNGKTKYLFTDEKGFPAELEWGWIPEVWEGTRIGEDIYVNIGPKKLQYRQIENPFKVKLGYHGVIYNAMNAPNISVMDRMKPFQYLYFIVMHKMKQILAADASPLINIDKSMIPKKLSNEEYLHYVKLGINFYDSQQNNEGGQPLSGQKLTYETQRSTAQHVVNYISILQALDEQIGEVAGVTRQREGQTSTYESVTGTQTAIVQSSHITETLFTVHNMLWEQILTTLLETAKSVWGAEERRMPYVLSDLTRGVLKVNPEDFQGVDMSVFITDNNTDNEVLNQMRQRSVELLQNGSKLSDVLKLYMATSAHSYLKDLEVLEAQRDAIAQNQEQIQSQTAEKIEEMRAQAMDKQIGAQMEIARMNNETKIEVAKITSFMGQEDQDSDDDGTPDQLEIAEFEQQANKDSAEIDLKQQKLGLDKKKIDSDKALKEKDLKVKDKKLTMDLKMQEKEMQMRDKEMKFEEKMMVEKLKMEKLKGQTAQKKAKEAASKPKTTPKK